MFQVWGEGSTSWSSATVKHWFSNSGKRQPACPTNGSTFALLCLRCSSNTSGVVLVISNLQVQQNATFVSSLKWLVFGKEESIIVLFSCIVLGSLVSSTVAAL
jgi:hypothetical protein